ncbi:unnamed protein product, partial [Mesorhabditis spiculigera]
MKWLLFFVCVSVVGALSWPYYWHRNGKKPEECTAQEDFVKSGSVCDREICSGPVKDCVKMLSHNVCLCKPGLTMKLLLFFVCLSVVGALEYYWHYGEQKPEDCTAQEELSTSGIMCDSEICSGPVHGCPDVFAENLNVVLNSYGKHHA